MTTVLVLTGAWILVGIPAAVAILRERQSPDRHFERAMAALGSQPTSPTLRLGVSLTRRRAQVASGIYAAAAACFTVGMVVQSPEVLGSSVVMANLGTFYRITVLRARAVAVQRRSPPTYVLPPAPIEPAMIAILGPVSTNVDRAAESPAEPIADGRAVLVG